MELTPVPCGYRRAHHWRSLDRCRCDLYCVSTEEEAQGSTGAGEHRAGSQMIYTVN